MKRACALLMAAALALIGCQPSTDGAKLDASDLPHLHASYQVLMKETGNLERSVAYKRAVRNVMRAFLDEESVKTLTRCLDRPDPKAQACQHFEKLIYKRMSQREGFKIATGLIHGKTIAQIVVVADEYDD